MASGRYFGKSKTIGAVSYSGRDAILYNLEWFENSITVPFEFISIKIPFMSDKILKRAFGEWEKPVMGGSEHGDVIYDVDKPYTFFLK
jgi:lipopolysaccharide cholinephosphotransferase